MNEHVSIEQNETKYDFQGQEVKQKTIKGSSNLHTKFKREKAIRKWASFFEDVKIDAIYGPTLFDSVKVDFYLNGLGIPVFLQDCNLGERKWIQGDVENLSKSIEGDCLIIYLDGKFVMQCFYTEEEPVDNRKCIHAGLHTIYLEEKTPENQTSQTIELSKLCHDVQLKICGQCSSPYFAAAEFFQGCKRCGYNDPENPNQIICHGNDGFLTIEQPTQASEEIQPNLPNEGTKRSKRKRNS